MGEIEGEPRACEDLGSRDMNFGQPMPGFQNHEFSLHADPDEFIAACSGSYREFAEDDLVYGEPDEEATVLELRRLKWPELDVLIRNHTEIGEQFFNRWMRYNALTAILSSCGPKTLPRFVVNEIAKISFQPHRITLSGLAVESGPA